MKQKRWICAVLAWVLAMIGVVAVVPTAAADEPPTLTVVGLAPEVYVGGAPIELTLQVTAGTEAWGDEPWIVQTYLQPTPFTTVEASDEFLAGSGFTGWRVDLTTVHATDRDTSGEITTLAITIPPEQLPANNPETSGARGLAVRLTTGDQTAETRSLLFYAPPEGSPQTAINLLAFDLSALADADNAEALAKQAEELVAIPGVSLAVMPTTLLPSTIEDEDGEDSSDDEDPTPMSGNDDTVELGLTDHQDALLTAGADLVVLPEGNADISALAAAQVTHLLNAALSSRNIYGQAPSEHPQIVDNVVVASTVGFTRESLAELQGQTVVAPASWAPAAEWNSWVTPTSLRLIDVETGETVPTGYSINPSTPATAVVSGWEAGNDLLNRPLGDDASELTLRQQLRTVSLQVGLEDPADQRHLSTVLNVSRETISPLLAKRARALLDSDWVEPVGLSEILNSTPSTVNVAAVPEGATGAAAPLTTYASAVAPVESAWATAQSVAASTPVGADLLTDVLPTTLAATAPGLSNAARSQAVEVALDALQPINEAITIVPLGAVNIVNRTANFRTTVSNTLDEPVTVRMSLLASDPRLQPERTVTTTVPAGGSTDVTIPVRAVASGDLTVQLVASTALGTVLDTSADVTVRIRPNWEDRATIVAGIALVVLFGFGIVRTVRRGRRRGRPDPNSADSETSGKETA